MAQIASGIRKIPKVDIKGAFVAGVDLSGASLVRANLSGANAKGAQFVGADFKDANLANTNLIGANLNKAQNLTVEQLRTALIDETTILPDYIDRQNLMRH